MRADEATVGDITRALSGQVHLTHAVVDGAAGGSSQHTAQMGGFTNDISLQLRFDFGDPGSGTIQIRNLRIGAYEPPVIDDLKQDENGTCLLSTAEDLATYAGYVNKGILLSAKLMNDIDYACTQTSLCFGLP